MKTLNQKDKLVIFGGGADLAIELSANLSSRYDTILLPRSTVDISDEVSVSQAMSYYKPDVAINCAGILNSDVITEGSSEKWRNAIEVGVLGAYYFSKFALLENRKCKLIQLSSTAAFNSYSDWSAYCIAKMSQVKISQALILEGYSVACYCPGAVDTKFRKCVTIQNDNILSAAEAVAPIVENLKAECFVSGVYFYRKGTTVEKLTDELSK